MKVLVVGASGFLGSAIVRKFLAEGAEIWGTYQRNRDSIPENCHAVSMKGLYDLEPGFDVVVLAAGNFSLTPKELISVNVQLTQKVVNRFASSRIVFISSISIYGNHNGTIRVQSSFNQPSFYGLSKLAGEAIVQTVPNYVILRPTYLYGKGMAARSFLPMIIQKAKTEKKITLFGRGERLQDYLHVKDAAQLCFLASSSDKNSIYLAATGKSISNLEVATTVQEYVPGCKINLSGTDTAPWFRFDPSPTIKELGWQPEHVFESSIEEMIV